SPQIIAHPIVFPKQRTLHPGASFDVRSSPRTIAFRCQPSKLLKHLFGTLVRKLLPLCRHTVLAFTGNNTYAPQALILVLGIE
ncbi:hypothetical protein, partial [Pseudomonas sp. BF-RE-24]|uniref:hypothetical protein n=1 Tax=Pseudomonas sp. BF-RE-24 TaxID=2832381 RepID=UPI001CBBF5F4